MINSHLKAQSQWVKTAGPGGGQSTGLYAKGDTLFSGNFEHFTLSATAVNAGTLYRSTNHGALWFVDSTGFFGIPISITHNGSSIFIATLTDGIYRSVDNGTTWSSLVGTNALSPNKLLTVNGVIYVGKLNGVSTSIDNGNTFISASVGLPGLANILCMAAAGDTIFVGVSSFNGNGVFRTVNNGASWQSVNTGLPVSTYVPNGLAANNNAVFASFDNGIYKTTNFGTSWVLSNAGITGSVTTLLATGDTLFAAVNIPSDWQVYRSTDNGLNWAPTGPGIPLSEAAFELVATGTEVYAGTGFYGSVYKTSNMGNSWFPANIGLPNLDTYDIFPSGNAFFSASLSNAGVHKSTDGGDTWLPSGAGLPGDFKITTCISENSGYLFAGTFYYGIYKSNDSGATWTPANTGLTVFALNINEIAIQGTDLFAGTWDGVYRSTNNGGNWVTTSPIAGGGVEITSIVSLAGELFAGTEINGLFKSSDNGNTWNLSDNGMFMPASVHSIIVRGTDLIAATGEGIYISIDNGLNWTAKNNGFASDLNTRTVAAKGDTLVTAIFHASNLVADGVYISYNNGTSWSDFGGSIAPFAIRKLTIIGNKVYAATETESAWNSALLPVTTAITENSTIYMDDILIYPNPLSEDITIIVTLKKAGAISTELFDAMGKEVKNIATKNLQQGNNKIILDLSALSAGVYFCKIKSDENLQTVKLIKN